MIENKFSFFELSEFLAPILGLKGITEVIEEFENILYIKIDHVDDLYKYFKKFKVTYDEFDIIIRGLESNKDGNIHIKLDFRIKNKWHYSFTKPEKRIVKAVQRICKKHIKDLEFANFRHSVFETVKNESKELFIYFYYDSLAFNKLDNEDGRRISPLIIGTSNNEKYRFVEFNFCALSYKKGDHKVELKDKWWEFMYY